MPSLIDQPLDGEPRLRLLRIRADQEHLLHGPRPAVQTLEPRIRRILNLKARRRVAPSPLDPPGDDARHVRALLHDQVEQRVEPADAAVLALDAAELHCGIVNRQSSMVNRPPAAYHRTSQAIKE